MGLPPGPLAAYLGVRNANEDAGLNTIKQATGIQGLLAKINEQKQLEMARGVMSGSLPQDQKLQNLMNINPALATKYATDMKSLEEYQQGQKFKTGMTALGPNPSQDSLAQLAAQFASPKDILTSQTSSVDRKAALEQARILREQSNKPNIVTGPDGTVRLYDNSGNLIRDLGPSGKPSAAFEKTKAAKKKMEYDLGEAITELEKATADGGLIDKSTGSGVGAGIDWAASLVGKATPGSIAVGQMKPIFDLALKMVPRFEGPQSDKDTQTYKEAAGELANPNVPNERKKAAGKEILRLMKARKGQFISKEFEGTEADSGASGWKDL